MHHIGRCGSTVLGDMLGRHAALQWDGEVFEPNARTWRNHAGDDDKADPLGFLRRRIASRTRPRYGFEMKFFHHDAIGVPLETFLDEVQSLGVSRFIVLRRRNYLRKIVSSLMAFATGRWHVRPGDAVSAAPVTINIDRVPIDQGRLSLLDLMRGFDRDFARLDELLADKPVLRLTYEEDIAHDPLQAYRKTCAFLGLDVQPVAVPYGKTTPFPLREVIANFDEVRAALRDTPYAWMLEE